MLAGIRLLIERSMDTSQDPVEFTGGVRHQPEFGRNHRWGPALAGPGALGRPYPINESFHRPLERPAEWVVFDSAHQTGAHRILQNVASDDDGLFVVADDMVVSVPLPQPRAEILRIIETRVLLGALDEVSRIRTL